MRTARQLMRRHVVVLAPGQRLAEVRDVMRLGRLRQLLVAEDGRVVGELSHRAVCRLYLEAATQLDRARLLAADQLPVHQLMMPFQGGVSPDARLHEITALLIARGCGYVPVVPGDADPHLLGIITEQDLLRLALMTPPPAAVAHRRRPAADRSP